jgi:Gpi18-like mannosyltransferase
MDGISYAWMAENFARGSFNEGLKGYFHPFYPIFMAIFSFVVGDMEINGRLLSLIFGILLIYFTFVLLKRFFGEKKALYG